jgi:hypothetical protein
MYPCIILNTVVLMKEGERVRVLHPPTLLQWGCAHRWKTTTTWPVHDDVVRMRYLTCRRCGLKVKTEERLVVPRDAGDFVDQVKALLPEGRAVALRDKGITELPLARLNARLVPYGCVIRARKGRDARQLVTYIGKDKGVEQFGLFELRQVGGEILCLKHSDNTVTSSMKAAPGAG